MIHMGGNTYELVRENKNGWNPEAFRDRYSEVLERYDYIVGDWGYNQLRLRGFFKEGNPKVNKESSIAGLEDYINEYCNFGCAYFIIERTNEKTLKPASEQFHELPYEPLYDGQAEVEEQAADPDQSDRSRHQHAHNPSQPERRQSQSRQQHSRNQQGRQQNQQQNQQAASRQQHQQPTGQQPANQQQPGEQSSGQQSSSQKQSSGQQPPNQQSSNQRQSNPQPQKRQNQNHQPANQSQAQKRQP